MSAVEDRFLDVQCKQDKSEDAGRIAGAGDAFVSGDLVDALVLALGQPAVPAMGPDQSVDQRDVRLRVAVRVHRLADGRKHGLAPGVTSQPGRNEDPDQFAVGAQVAFR